MGVVYKARQKGLNRLVALKMVLGAGHASDEELIRFRNEAAAIARLSHPAIVQIYEVGEHDGMPYFAMEYCPGGSLSSHAAGHPLNPDRAARLVARLAEGMYHAHQAGVIHRDLKPSNVLAVRLDDAGRPIDGPSDLTEVIRGTKGDLEGVALKIADFGLARQMEGSGQTRSGDLLGTPSYMAPEQAAARHSDVGPPTDVWALGAILYDLLSGRPPFRGSTVMETMRLVIEQEPVALRQLRPDVPRDLETICHKCLQKDRSKRYPSAKELADDLTRFVVGQPIHARPVGVAERVVRWARRRPALAALSGLLALTLVGVVVGWAAFTVALREQRDRADRNRIEAEKNAEEARQNFRLAEERFLLAMKVVDRYFTEVSESPQLTEAGLESLRRSLLLGARSFYTDFVKTREKDEPLRRELVRSQYRLGLIDADVGDLPGAVRLFDEALTRQGAIPKDDAVLKDRALLLHHRGRVSRLLDRLDQAEGSYKGALAAWRELRQNDDRAEYRDGEATTILGLGNVALARKDFARAKQRYAEALALRRQLVKADAKNEAYRRNLATAWQNLATGEQSLGDRKAATAARAEALKTQQYLVKEFPGRVKYREDLAMSWYNRGTEDLREGRPADAVTACGEAIRLFSALAQAHPEVPRFRGLLADVYGNLAFGHQRTGKPAEAMQDRRFAVEARRDLARDFPGVPEHQVGLARGLRQVGEAALAGGSPTEARTYLTEARDLLAGVKGDQRLLRAEVLHELGLVELREEKFPAAREAFEAALAVLGDKPPAGVLPVRASCFLNLGLIARLSQVAAAALPCYDRVEELAAALRKDARLTARAEAFLQDALRGRALALDQLGRFDDALAQWALLSRRQTGPDRTLTEARRLVTLAATPHHAEAAEQADRLAAPAAAVRYELARAQARAAVQAGKDERLASPERGKRQQERRQAALRLLGQLSKEGAFVPAAARRRLLREADFAELRATQEWKALLADEKR
jgi:serine/threonine-protein kinase